MQWRNSGVKWWMLVTKRGRPILSASMGLRLSNMTNSANDNENSVPFA